VYDADDEEEQKPRPFYKRRHFTLLMLPSLASLAFFTSGIVIYILLPHLVSISNTCQQLGRMTEPHFLYLLVT
jgi:hypothetical protein